MMATTCLITDLETRFIQVNEMNWRTVQMLLDVKLSRDEITFEDTVKTLVEDTGISKDATKTEDN